MKFTKFLTVIAAMFALVGCGTIETGNVGVRTSWDGKIQMQEDNPGFYVAITSSVEQFSAREIAISLDDMKPKAKDNLSMSDMDVEVYYKAQPGVIAELTAKYANRHAYDSDAGVWYPGYHLVRGFARDAVYAVVAEYDSLDIHKNRDLIRDKVHARLQAMLDTDDKGSFEVTKVVVRNAQTDPTIEDSIKKAVAKNKELDAKVIENNIAAEQVKINNALTQSLSPEILKQMELDTIREVCSSKGSTCILSVGGASATPLINVR